MRLMKTSFSVTLLGRVLKRLSRDKAEICDIGSITKSFVTMNNAGPLT